MERHGAKWCDAYIVNTHAYIVNQALALLSKLTVGASFMSVIEIVNALVRLNPLLSVTRIVTVCVVLFS